MWHALDTAGTRQRHQRSLLEERLTKLKVKSESESLSSVQFFATPWTIPGILQVRILEQVAFPSSRDLPNQVTESRSPVLQADSLPAEPQGKPY